MGTCILSLDKLSRLQLQLEQSSPSGSGILSLTEAINQNAKAVDSKNRQLLANGVVGIELIRHIGVVIPRHASAQRKCSVNDSCNTCKERV